MTTPMIALAIWCFTFGFNLAAALLTEYEGKWFHWILVAVSALAIPYYILRLEGIL